MMKKKQFTKLFYALLFFATIGNITSYVYFNGKLLNIDFFMQIIGLLLLPCYQIAIFNNKPRFIGLIGIIIDLIQIIIFYKLKIFGLMITYMYGIVTETVLVFKGKDNYIEQKSWRSYIIQIIVVLVVALLMYMLFRDKTLKVESVIFDLISTVLVPVAYYLQAKQSTKQFVFWVTSDFTGLMPPIFAQDTYSIIAFVFYIIFDSLNWIKWAKFSRKTNNEI